jgi:aminoglycoside phosphotransferase (APT) family kinase protein
MTAPEPDLDAFLVEQRLAPAGTRTVWRALGGGVSSEIWRVDTPRGPICVKRALARLKVEADWTAPVARNEAEWAYIETVSRIVPEAMVPLIAHDPSRGLFAMGLLAPDLYPVWKSALLDGRVEPDDAARVGNVLGRIHAATARHAGLAARFAHDDTFHALRIDAYLLETARKHPALAEQLGAMAARTARTKLALMHGDVSPKNVLLGPKGPVLIDAETACYGDPAFDLAFCLNHLAIKRFVVRGADEVLATSAARLWESYRAHIGWEEKEALEARAASLLPALALARVDGKSPVEYLNEPQRVVLRTRATKAVIAAPQVLPEALDLLAP